LKLISWNTAHRLSRISEQVSALLSLKPDIVALQEVIPSTAKLFSALLTSGGLSNKEGLVVRTGRETCFPNAPRVSLAMLASKPVLRSLGSTLAFVARRNSITPFTKETDRANVLPCLDSLRRNGACRADGSVRLDANFPIDGTNTDHVARGSSATRSRRWPVPHHRHRPPQFHPPPPFRWYENASMRKEIEILASARLFVS
jgi:hypothetical protein